MEEVIETKTCECGEDCSSDCECTCGCEEECKCDENCDCGCQK